jgi:hypothetical protein
LAARFGARFKTPALLRQMAEKGETFYPNTQKTAA